MFTRNSKILTHFLNKIHNNRLIPAYCIQLVVIILVGSAIREDHVYLLCITCKCMNFNSLVETYFISKNNIVCLFACIFINNPLTVAVEKKNETQFVAKLLKHWHGQYLPWHICIYNSAKYSCLFLLTCVINIQEKTGQAYKHHLQVNRQRNF